MQEFDILDCSYPPSFFSTSGKEYFTRLPLLSHDVLLSCARRFRASIPKECQTKPSYINLIQDDFVQQTKQLIHSSTPELQALHSVTARRKAHTSFVIDLPVYPQSIWVCHRFPITMFSSSLEPPPQVTEDEIPHPTWF
jgi:hypothetical protein